MLKSIGFFNPPPSNNNYRNLKTNIIFFTFLLFIPVILTAQQTGRVTSLAVLVPEAHGLTAELKSGD